MQLGFAPCTLRVLQWILGSLYRPVTARLRAWDSQSCATSLCFYEFDTNYWPMLLLSQPFRCFSVYLQNNTPPHKCENTTVRKSDIGRAEGICMLNFLPWIKKRDYLNEFISIGCPNCKWVSVLACWSIRWSNKRSRFDQSRCIKEADQLKEVLAQIKYEETDEV